MNPFNIPDFRDEMDEREKRIISAIGEKITPMHEDIAEIKVRLDGHGKMLLDHDRSINRVKGIGAVLTFLTAIAEYLHFKS